MARDNAGAVVRIHPAEGTAVPLAAHRTLDIDPAGISFLLRAPDGQVELTVRVTEAGPVLSFSGARIEITEARALSVDVEQLSLRSGDIHVESTGSVQQVVAGNSVLHCGGRHEVQADGVALVSHGEELVLDSSRDVTIQGERVLINC